MLTLIHCGPVTPYSGIGLDQHWLRQGLVVWQHQAMCLTNVDWFSQVLCGIHLVVISQEVLKIHLKIAAAYLRALQYIPRNMHTVFALLCFVVVIHWLIFPYPSGLLHWHCGNLTIAPVPAKQPWWIWINTSYEFIMNDCITTTKQSTTKPCAYFLGYTVCVNKKIP